jgi:hypothetical protein
MIATKNRIFLMVNTILRGKITTNIWNTQGFSEKKSNFLFFFCLPLIIEGIPLEM